MGEGSGGWRCYCWAGPNCWAGQQPVPCPLLCLFYSFYFLFLFISSLWHMGKASPCSPRRPPRRRLALQTGSLAVPRLNALRTEQVQSYLFRDIPILITTNVYLYNNTSKYNMQRCYHYICCKEPRTATAATITTTAWLLATIQFNGICIRDC